MDLSVNVALKGFISTANMLNVRWGGQFLWNLGRFDPPLFVAGIRAGYSTTITDERPGEDSGLPPGLRTYLGGAADLRGFSRRELAYDGRGGLTSLFAGAELRAAGLLPWGIQPFVFFDAGSLGRLPVLVTSPFYLSPGFGVRVESPIGVFRGTLAHGYSVGDIGGPDDVPASRPSHWQLYLSYGEEF
jgi:translocation and assembly module TamA